AWILLEFDAAYVRNFSRTDDSGYVIGKLGSIAEIMTFLAGNQFDDRTMLLHYVTSCLRVADLTVVEGSFHYPIEIKLDSSKKRHRLDKRERRQKRRGDNLWEFYARKKSTKLWPGVPAFRINTKSRDRHHWDVLSKAFLEAGKTGYSLRFAEEGIAYGVCHHYKQLDSLILGLTKSWSKPVLLFGELYEHVIGLPEIMPFTLFEIPFDLKKEILFQDCFVFGFVEMNGVCNTMTKLGVEASLEDKGIRFKAHGFEVVMGGNVLDRLRYECLSTQTLRKYALLSIRKLAQNAFLNTERPSLTPAPHT
ncbi:MAG TPA: hypothetical protein VF016_04770, partial [Nitrososphaera sp.]